MTRALSLHHLSALDLSVPEFLKTAHAAGFEYACLFVCGWPTDDFKFPTVTPGLVYREVLAILRDTGLKIFSMDAPFIFPGVRLDDYQYALDIGASLGAMQSTVVVGDPDTAQAVDSFARYAELAGLYGLNADVEFMAMSPISTIGKAVELVQAAKQPQKSIAIDMLHLMRTGGTAADIRALSAGIIGNVQMCDGLLHRPETDWVMEAMTDRSVPGEGQFPLHDIVAALPEDAILSVEVPNDERRRASVTPLEWAQTLHDAARQFVPETQSQTAPVFV